MSFKERTLTRAFRNTLIAVFFFVVIFDRLTKANFDHFISTGDSSFFFIARHLNSGFILNLLSDSSPFARVVFVLSGYGFLFFMYFLIQMVLSEPFPKLRFGLTLFFAAITGNSYDRAINGAVTDFIGIRLLGQSFFLNFADMAMWVGAGLTIFGIFQAGENLWHPESKRKGFLIDRAFQYGTALQLMLISFSTSLVVILFSYTYFKSVSIIPEKVRFAYFLVALALSALFSAVTFFVGVFFSHRSVGPLYALEKYVDSLLDDKKTKHFKLRRGDYHQARLKRLSEKILKAIERGPNGDSDGISPPKERL